MFGIIILFPIYLVLYYSFLHQSSSTILHFHLREMGECCELYMSRLELENERSRSVYDLYQ